ncbi:MAG TPA: hypothetical protein VFQ85_12740 [Mycobacteriales bacterium]|jgi:hypothetical protein|nr:hypothetical protein [Mycobacteriales bacterium]
MRLTTRRVLLACVAAVAITASPAGATVCSGDMCVDPSTVKDLLTNAIGKPPIGTGDGSGGVLCGYTKLSGDPPEGWGGDPHDDPPYIFVETEAWGVQHPDDWDIQACAPACPPAPDESLDDILTAASNPLEPGDPVTPTADTVACATG